MRTRKQKSAKARFELRTHRIPIQWDTRDDGDVQVHRNGDGLYQYWSGEKVGVLTVTVDGQEDAAVLLARAFDQFAAAANAALVITEWRPTVSFGGRSAAMFFMFRRARADRDQ